MPNTKGGRLLIFKNFIHAKAFIKTLLLILAKQCPELNMIFIPNFVRKIKINSNVFFRKEVIAVHFVSLLECLLSEKEVIVVYS